jgi:hypothetical protein
MIAPVSAIDFRGEVSFSIGCAVFLGTSDRSYLDPADFIASDCTFHVGTSANHSGGMTGAVRIALSARSFLPQAKVHGSTDPALDLCMTIPDGTYYASLVTSNPPVREQRIGSNGLVRAPPGPGIALPDFIQECRVTTR